MSNFDKVGITIQLHANTIEEANSAMNSSCSKCMRNCSARHCAIETAHGLVKKIISGEIADTPENRWHIAHYNFFLVG